MKNGFLNHVTESIAKLLNEILSEEGFHLFRRGSRVVTGIPLTASSQDLHLYFAGYDVVERDGGTLRLEQDGTALVLRSPDRLRLKYALRANASAMVSRIETWDRLLAYFFDNPSADPFIPENLQTPVGLHEILRREKAVFVIRPPEEAEIAGGRDPVSFGLHYTALYHSGGVMDRESLVKQRVIEYRNRERSIT